MEASRWFHDLIALLPGKEPPVPIGWEGDWVSHRAGVNTVAKRENLLLPGIEPLPFQLVASRYPR